MNLGKSWKGGATLVPIECHPEERQRRGVSSVQLRGWTSPSQNSPKRL